MFVNYTYNDFFFCKANFLILPFRPVVALLSCLCGAVIIEWKEKKKTFD